MKVLIALLYLAWAGFCLPVFAQQAGLSQPSERRVALVIGNNDYVGTSRLERAVTDARAIGTELRQVGFQVIEHSNLDRRGMNQAINELVDKAAGGGVAVLFFAGHGVQVSGTNYLLPTDIKVSRAEDLADEAIDLGRVMDRLAQAKAKFALLIIDACRDNPFPRTAGRSIGALRGLTIPAAPDGLMVVYSAGVNEQALDKLDANDRDPNGLFTREFLKLIRQPGLRVDEMVRRVRASVREQALRVGHSQNPAIYDQAQGDFFFVSPIATQTAVAPAAAPVAQAASKSEEAAYELAFWDAIKSTQLASDFEEYLRQFPTGRFAGLAKSRRDRLLAQALPAAQTKPATPSALQGQALAGQAVSVSPLNSGPTGASELNAPTNLAAIRGKRYFGRSATFEIEVEVVSDGLNVVRFGTVDGKAQYRCGLFRNEIAVGRDMTISDQLCGSSGGSVINRNSFYPRMLSGTFPLLNVAKANPYDTIAAQQIHLIEDQLRGEFDAQLKVTPELTTESFSKGR